MSAAPQVMDEVRATPSADWGAPAATTTAERLRAICEKVMNVEQNKLAFEEAELALDTRARAWRRRWQ